MTKSEAKKLADLRNKFGALQIHFKLISDLQDLYKKDIVAYEVLKERLDEIFQRNEREAIDSMKEIKEILDSFG